MTGWVRSDGTIRTLAQAFGRSAIPFAGAPRQLLHPRLQRAQACFGLEGAFAPVARIGLGAGDGLVTVLQTQAARRVFQNGVGGAEQAMVHGILRR